MSDNVERVEGAVAKDASGTLYVWTEAGRSPIGGYVPGWLTFGYGYVIPDDHPGITQPMKQVFDVNGVFVDTDPNLYNGQRNDMTEDEFREFMSARAEYDATHYGGTLRG